MAPRNIVFKSASLLALLGLLGLASGARAGLDSWDLTPLQGGSPWSIAVDPNDSGQILLESSTGIFLSTDGGTTWTKTHDEPGEAVAIGSDGTVYQGGVRRSEDGGVTWQDLTNELTNPNWTNAGGVTVIQGTPDTLYVATNRGVFRSTNRAQNWTYLGGNGLNIDDIRAIAVDPEDHNVLLVGTYDGVYRSENGGSSWSQTSMGSGNRDVYRLAIAPNHQVWAGTSDGIRRSEDGGRTWISSGLPGSYISALLWVAPNKLYAARETPGNSLFLSTDGGRVWSPVAGLPEYAKVPSLAYTDHLYAGLIGLGVYQQRQSGWEATSQGMNGLRVSYMVKSPADTNVYLGTEAGVLRYTPSTKTVSLLAEGMGQPDVTALVAAVGRDGPSTGVLYAATDGGGVFKLNIPPSYPPTWTSLGTGGVLPASVEDLGVEYLDTLFAVSQGRLYKWVGGTNPQDWRVLGGIIPSYYGDGVRLVEVARDQGTLALVVYVVTHQARIFRSADGGRSWAERNANWCVGNCGGLNRLWIDPSDPQIIYVSGQGGNHRSDDGGGSWRWMNPPCCGGEFSAVVADPSNPREIYMGYGGQVLQSFNRGEYVRDIGLPFNNQQSRQGEWISALAFARGSNHLYASVAGWVMDAQLSDSGPVVNNFWFWRRGGIFPGEDVILNARVTAGDTALASVQVLVRPQPNAPPIATVDLLDNGVAPDSTANDGYFSARWAGTTQVGGYTLDLVAVDVVGRQTQWRDGITVAHTLISIPDAMLISPEQLRTSKVPVLIEDDGDGYLSEKKFLSLQVGVHNWSQGLEPLGMHMDTTGTLLGGKAGLLDTNSTMSFQPDRKWNSMLALSSADSLQLLPGAQPQQGILAYIHLDSMLVNSSQWCNFGVNSILFNEDGAGAVATSWGSNLALGRGDVDTSGVIGPFDAALVLMHVVGKANLDSGQDPKNDPVEAQYHFTLPSFTNYMAEVSGQMGITALDAALIMRRDVGIISHFPTEEGYYRLWDPPGRWWNPPTPMAPKPVATLPRLNRVVSLGEGEAREDGGLAVPVLIDQLEGVLAGSLVLGFDPGQLQVVGVEAGELTDDYLWDHQVEGGELRVAFAGAESRPGSGALVQVRFVRVGVSGAGSGGVVLRQSQLNEEEVVYHERAVVSAVVPGQLALHTNYPNPFNPATAIGYALPGDSQVRLSVYSLLGQRIRLLVEERQEAGIHQVVWDGRDGQGQVVASGVYLYRLETEGGVLVRRMLLLK